MDTNDDEADIQHMLECLASPTAKDRAFALRSLAAAPLADLRLLAASEQLLSDEALALLSIPYAFGEVRCMAADAVAALRGALQLSEAVRLVDVPIVLTPNTLGTLAGAAGLSSDKGGLEGSIELFHKLRELGLVPRRNILRTPCAPMT